MLGDIPYYVPATPYTTVTVRALGRLQSVNGLSPVTVIGATASNASVGSLGSILAGFAIDDVWNPNFLQGTSLAAGSSCIAPTIPDSLVSFQLR